jgi:hypothetical protein
VSDQVEIFGALLQQRRSRWPIWIGLGVLILTLLTVLAARNDGGLRVPTPRGFAMIRPGMSRGDTQHELGQPLNGQRQADGTECYLYGHPTLNQPTFTLYRACYRDGTLVQIVPRKYTASQIDPSMLHSAPTDK